MKSLKKMRAFTLIELIVVIVIIGILLALAAVGYLSFVNNSNKKASFASAKQAATVIQGLSSTSQTKVTDLAAGTVVADDGVNVLTTIGAGNPFADGVIVVETTATGDITVCSVKGNQVSSITFAGTGADSAAGTPPTSQTDASAGQAAPAACPAADAVALAAGTTLNNI